MITNFKIFEKVTKIIFKVGDSIFLNTDNFPYINSNLPNHKYKINKIYNQNFKGYIEESNDLEDFCNVIDTKTGQEYQGYYLKNFISEDEYNLRQNVNKYNL